MLNDKGKVDIRYLDNQHKRFVNKLWVLTELVETESLIIVVVVSETLLETWNTLDFILVI